MKSHDDFLQLRPQRIYTDTSNVRRITKQHQKTAMTLAYSEKTYKWATQLLLPIKF
jgi:hypothetical protein